MKKIVFICVSCFFIACEDVVDIDTPSEAPRLIVEALIRVDRSQETIPFEVKVTETSNFFEDIPVASLESILLISTVYDEDGIIMSSGVSYLDEAMPGSGLYMPEQEIPSNTFDSEIVFELIIYHEGRKYYAKAEYVPSVPIDSVIQGDNTLFSDDDTEIIVTFTDNAERDDFYVFDFGFGNYLVSEDEFYQGQQFEFSYFYDMQFEPGTEVTIGLLGADERFYNYMNQLIEQSGEQDNPFQTPVSTVRGNIFDITDLDNIEVFDNVEQPDVFPLGYFAIVEEYKQTITIE